MDTATGTENNDQNGFAFPSVLLFSRKMLPNRIVARLVQLICGILFGIALPALRLLGAHEANTKLAWVHDLCTCVGCCLLSQLAPGLHDAVLEGGGLDKLGLTTDRTTIGARGRSTLARWKVIFVVLAAVFGLMSLLMFTMAVTMVGKRSKLTGRLITPTYSLVIYYAGLGTSCASAVFSPWGYAAVCGSVVAGEAVRRVIDAVDKLNPGSPEWQTEVVQGITKLASTTLPDLSNAFGNTLGYVTLAFWLLSLANFAEHLQADEFGTFVIMLIFAFMPFGFATTVTDTATTCDTLRERLNTKRADDLSNHPELIALETYMKELNRGQGLGFTVFGIVIDVTMVNKIYSALCVCIKI
jgi:hypothetical protein